MGARTLACAVSSVMWAVALLWVIMGVEQNGTDVLVVGHGPGDSE